MMLVASVLRELCQNHAYSNHVFTRPRPRRESTFCGGRKTLMSTCIYIYIYIYIHIHIYVYVLKIMKVAGHFGGPLRGRPRAPRRREFSRRGKRASGIRILVWGLYSTLSPTIVSDENSVFQKIDCQRGEIQCLVSIQSSRVGNPSCCPLVYLSQGPHGQTPPPVTIFNKSKLDLLNVKTYQITHKTELIHCKLNFINSSNLTSGGGVSLCGPYL